MRVRKTILTILILISALFSVLADYDSNRVEQEWQNFVNEMISRTSSVLTPYDGAANLDMRSLNYPARKDGGTLTWQGDEYNLNEITNDSNSEYLDKHMIAIGGVEGFPLKYSFSEYDRYDWLPHYDYYEIRAKDISLYLTVDSPSDFYFVSQGNTSYRRRFDLYYVYKTGQADSATGIPNSPAGTVKKIEGYYDEPIEIKLDSTRDQVGGVWFDMIIALPYDGAGDGSEGYNDVGVIDDKVLYPLTDANDYTATVTIKMELKVSADVYHQNSVAGLQDYDYKESKEAVTIASREIIVPFSGYSYSFGDAPEPAVGSLYISTTAEAQNINLNPGAMQGSVKISDIAYTRTFASATSGLTDPNGTDAGVAWIFLSANPEPEDKNLNGFNFIKDDAGDTLTSRNSVSFILDVEGVNESYGNISGSGSNSNVVTFDGTESVLDYPNVSQYASSPNFIHTTCEFGESLPHVFEGGGSRKTYYHYHSFEGEIYLRLDGQTTNLAPGRYLGDIYVHVVSDR